MAFHGIILPKPYKGGTFPLAPILLKLYYKATYPRSTYGFKKIKKLISLVESSNISALSLEEENIKIEIKETSQQIIQTTVQPQQAPVENTPKAPIPPSKNRI